MNSYGQFADRTLRAISLKRNILFVTNNSSRSILDIQSYLVKRISPLARVIGTQHLASCLYHFFDSLGLSITFHANPSVESFIRSPYGKSHHFSPPLDLLQSIHKFANICFVGLQSSSASQLPIPSDHLCTLFVYLNRDRSCSSDPSLMTHPLLGDLTHSEAPNTIHLCKSHQTFLDFCRANGFFSDIRVHIGDNMQTDGAFAKNVHASYFPTTFARFSTSSHARSRILKQTSIALIEYRSQYLLQLRDNNPNISSPGLWGFFGGTVEPYETSIVAIQRELFEEIGLTADPLPFYFHTLIHADLDRQHPSLFEDVFHVRIDSSFNLDNLVLAEGRDMSLFTAEDILSNSHLFSPATCQYHPLPSPVPTVLAAYLRQKHV